MEQKLINTNVMAIHNAIATSHDQQSWRSSFNLIQTLLQMINEETNCYQNEIIMQVNGFQKMY